MASTREERLESIKQKLITAGVRNLKEFGYPYANNENILTDEIYKAFFSRMLDDNIGNGEIIDDAINLIRKQI